MPSPKFGAQVPNFGGGTGGSVTAGIQNNPFVDFIMKILQGAGPTGMPQANRMPPVANPNLSGFWNERGTPDPSMTVPPTSTSPVGGGVSGFWGETSNPNSGANPAVPIQNTPSTNMQNNPTTGAMPYDTRKSNPLMSGLMGVGH